MTSRLPSSQWIISLIWIKGFQSWNFSQMLLQHFTWSSEGIVNFTMQTPWCMVAWCTVHLSKSCFSLLLAASLPYASSRCLSARCFSFSVSLPLWLPLAAIRMHSGRENWNSNLWHGALVHRGPSCDTVPVKPIWTSDSGFLRQKSVLRFHS